jgi:hypothetical protein
MNPEAPKKDYSILFNKMAEFQTENMILRIEGV